MKKLTLSALALLTCAASCLALPGAEFSIKKVDVDLSASPDFPTNPPVRWTPQKWVKMEVTFDAAPEFTEELSFNYYLLFGDRLLVGHVNHVNITKGQGLHSVMYVAPKTLQRLLGTHKAAGVVSSNLPITQVTVTITKPGVATSVAVGHYKPGGQEGWWAPMKQEEGFLLNKNETPFAPLYWDYYEAIKPASAR